jgi:hypothetical protein
MELHSIAFEHQGLSLSNCFFQTLLWEVVVICWTFRVIALFFLAYFFLGPLELPNLHLFHCLCLI